MSVGKLTMYVYAPSEDIKCPTLTHIDSVTCTRNAMCMQPDPVAGVCTIGMEGMAIQTGQFTKRHALGNKWIGEEHGQCSNCTP